MVEAPNQIVFQQLGLGSVLKQYRLFVPPNQREYAWTDDEVMQLFRDFAKAIADDEPGYFLGTIVTIPRSDGALEVVDGQQLGLGTPRHDGDPACVYSRLSNR